MEQVGANPGGADGECELNTPEEMEMDKEQKVWRKAWEETSGEGDLENCGIPRVEEKGLGSGQPPGTGWKQRMMQQVPLGQPQ